jgi:hypothetical protein
MVSIPGKSCHSLVWFSMPGSCVFTNPLNSLSCGEWSGEGPTRREEYPVASQIVKERGVPGLHRPVGEQHIDLTRGIKVMGVGIDDGGKDVFPIRLEKTIRHVKDGEQVRISWAGVERRIALHAGQQNRRESPRVRCQLGARSRRFMVSVTSAAVTSSSQA